MDVEVVMNKHPLFKWQYDGIVPYGEIIEWCYNHIPNDWWTNGSITVYFGSQASYTMFIMRWA